MSDRLTDNLIAAWQRLRPRLLADNDELARRVARRRTPQLLRTLGGAVDLTAWRSHDLRQAAAKLGVGRYALRYQRGAGRWFEDRIAGLGGRHGDVPLIWKSRVSDPNASGHKPPDEVWGHAWKWLADGLPDDFSQTLVREPCYRRGQWMGWSWVCPRCGRPVRTAFLPTRVSTIVEWLGDREILDRLTGTDALRPPDATFACQRCHRVWYWNSVAAGSWNLLVTTLSGGLLYGHEVRRPAGLTPVRKRAIASRRAEHPRADQLERLLIEGKSYVEAAAAMGVTLNTVCGHVRAIYKRRGVHSRGELIASRRD